METSKYQTPSASKHSSGLLSPLILTLLRDPDYFFHLSGRETEIQKGEVTCLWLYRCSVVEERQLRAI